MRSPWYGLHSGIHAISQQRRGLLVVMGVALVIKLVVLVLLADKPPNVDGIRYLRAAQEMGAGNFGLALEIYPMPAYPFLIMVTKWLVQDWLLAARLLSIAGLFGATWFLYRITLHLFDRRAAFWAGLAFALMAFQNEMGVLVYRGPIYLCVFAWATLWMLESVADPRPWRIAAAAWIGCAAAMFRIEGVFLAPMFLAYMLIAAGFVPSQRRRLLAGVGLWLLSAAIIVGTFLLLDGTDHLGLGRLDQVWSRLRELGGAGLLGNYERISEGLKAIEAASDIPSQDMNFGEIALDLFWLIYLLGLLKLCVQLIGAASVLPLYLGARAGMTRARAFVWIVFAAYMTVLYASLVQTDFSGGRFVLAATFLLYPFVGAGVSRLAAWIPGRTRRTALWLLFYFLVIVAPLMSTAGKMEAGDLSSVEAGHWLARSEYNRTRFVGNDPRIPYAAGVPLYSTSDQYLHHRPEDRDYSEIERVAIETKRPLIFLKLRKSRLERLPEFTRFREIRRFYDEDKIVFVFADPGAIRDADATPNGHARP